MQRIAVIIVFLVWVFGGCKKDPKTVNEQQPETNYSGEVKVNITNVADNLIVQVTKDTIYTSLTPKYINAGDTFFTDMFTNVAVK